MREEITCCIKTITKIDNKLTSYCFVAYSIVDK